MKREDVDTFEKLKAQLDSLHEEISILAKKSPNDAVNTFKLKFVNSILRQCNAFLGGKYRPFPDFGEFSTDELPSNGDVTFIISQYIECAEKMRSDNIHSVYTSWYWTITDSDEQVRTARPKKIKDN